MTWTTPLAIRISEATTRAEFTKIPPPLIVMVRVSPLAVVRVVPFERVDE
jgi:hypothetical protein